MEACGWKRRRDPPTSTRCLIPRFDGVILSLEWKEAIWDRFVTGAPRPHTPSEPRSANDRRKAFQNGSASEGPVATPSTSRRPSVLTPTAIIAAVEDDASALAHLEVGGVDPQVGPLAFNRARQERAHPLVDLGNQAAHLALRYAAGTHGLDQIIDRTGRHPVDVSFLDYRRQRLVRRPAQFQKAREVTTLAQLGNRQFNPTSAGVPAPFAVAGLRLPAAAPVLASISRSIMRSAANASISRTKSLSAPCLMSSTRAILSSVIVFFSRFEFASEPYQKIDGGHPLRETFLHPPWDTTSSTAPQDERVRMFLSFTMCQSYLAAPRVSRGLGHFHPSMQSDDPLPHIPARVEIFNRSQAAFHPAHDFFPVNQGTVAHEFGKPLAG